VEVVTRPRELYIRLWYRTISASTWVKTFGMQPVIWRCRKPLIFDNKLITSIDRFQISQFSVQGISWSPMFKSGYTITVGATKTRTMITSSPASKRIYYYTFILKASIWITYLPDVEGNHFSQVRQMWCFLKVFYFLFRESRSFERRNPHKGSGILDIIIGAGQISDSSHAGQSPRLLFVADLLRGLTEFYRAPQRSTNKFALYMVFVIE
jgi:hypothetical protein